MKKKLVGIFFFIFLRNINYNGVEDNLKQVHFWLEKSYDTLIYWVLKIFGSLSLLTYSSLNFFLICCGLALMYTGANLSYGFTWYYGRWALNIGENSIHYIPAVGLAKVLLRVSNLEAYFRLNPMPPSLWIHGLGLPWFWIEKSNIDFERYLKIEEILKYRDEILSFFKNQQVAIEDILLKLAKIRQESSTNLDSLKTENRYETCLQFSDSLTKFVSIPPNLPLNLWRRINLEEERGYIQSIQLCENRNLDPIVVVDLKDRQNYYPYSVFLEEYANLPNKFIVFLQERQNTELLLKTVCDQIVICPEYLNYLLNFSPEGCLILQSCKEVREISLMFKEWILQKLLESEQSHTPEIVQKVLDYLPKQKVLENEEDKPIKDLSKWWAVSLFLVGVVLLGGSCFYMGASTVNLPEVKNYLDFKNLDQI